MSICVVQNVRLKVADYSFLGKLNLTDHSGEEYSYYGEVRYDEERISKAFGEGLGRYIDRPQVTIDGAWLDNKRHGLGRYQIVKFI